MIKIEATENPNLIEEVVCRKIRDAVKHPMSDDLAKVMIGLWMTPKEFGLPDNEKPLLYKIIEKRLQCVFTFKTDDARLILFLCIISKTPAIAIMYLWYIQSWCFVNGVREVDMNTFTTRIFPMGFLSDDDLKSIWDSQKVFDGKQTYNLVDIVVAGALLQFEATPA